MLITALAWMSLRASLTLSGILTAILLPCTILMARRSLSLAGMTLAMLAMLWRGEAWKTVFLQSERRVSELELQLQPPVSPKTESESLGRLILCADPHFASPCGAIQLLALVGRDEYHILSSNSLGQPSVPELREETSNSPLSLAEAYPAVSFAQWQPAASYSPIAPILLHSCGNDLNRFSPELPYRSWPNTNSRVLPPIGYRNSKVIFRCPVAGFNLTDSIIRS
jgi:hypothetical protein